MQSTTQNSNCNSKFNTINLLNSLFLLTHTHTHTHTHTQPPHSPTHPHLKQIKGDKEKKNSLLYRPFSSFSTVLRSVMLVLLCLSLTSCSSDKNFRIGVTPSGIPVTLNIHSSGAMTINFAGVIKTPFATLSIGTDSHIQPHRTYVELHNRRENIKHVFELAQNNTVLNVETSGRTNISVERRRSSTIVIIDSDEISNFLYQGSMRAKPSFPSHLWQYFVVARAFNRNIDWSVNSVGDFFAIILFSFIWVFAALIDVFIIVASFSIRLVIWLFLLLFYAIRII